jgi:hypothetical protein
MGSQPLRLHASTHLAGGSDPLPDPLFWAILASDPTEPQTLPASEAIVYFDLDNASSPPLAVLTTNDAANACFDVDVWTSGTPTGAHGLRIKQPGLYRITTSVFAGGTFGSIAGLTALQRADQYLYMGMPLVSHATASILTVGYGGDVEGIGPLLGSYATAFRNDATQDAWHASFFCYLTVMSDILNTPLVIKAKVRGFALPFASDIGAIGYIAAEQISTDAIFVE